jgi:hypothetical protein
VAVHEGLEGVPIPGRGEADELLVGRDGAHVPGRHGEESRIPDAGPRILGAGPGLSGGKEESR